ncbi:MAG: hypothetical protein FJZ58_06425 [Chlamydiae bacterium]|nr:hypothetical protein [Chlamydiota bacterium]
MLFHLIQVFIFIVFSFSQVYALSIEELQVENIHSTVHSILSIPQEEQTFDNTIRSWYQLSAQVSTSSDELYTYLLSLAQEQGLYQHLINCSSNIKNTDLDPFQRYLVARFVGNALNDPVCIRGTAEEKSTPTNDCTLFAFETSEFSMDDLTHEILSENFDAICIHEIFSDSDAYDLYKLLRRSYAYFIYVPPSVTPGFSCTDLRKGVLIAGKFREDPFRILLARSERGSDKQAGRGMEFGIEFKYGGNERSQVDGYIKGEAHDSKGNYIEGRVDHNFNENEGSVGVRAGNKDEGKN